MKNKWILLLCLMLMACANAKLQAIKGKDGTEMQQEKGAPITKVRESGREMWTYRDGTCTEMIFFDSNGKVVDLHELGECTIPE